MKNPLIWLVIGLLLGLSASVYRPASAQTGVHQDERQTRALESIAASLQRMERSCD